MGNNVSRMKYIDAMKGIAILMVVVMHSLMNADTNADSNYAGIINFIAYLAVPSFFFINGYLYNHKYALNPVKGIIKKFKSYYIPFVGFSLFFWLFHNLFSLIHFSQEAMYDIKDYISHFFLMFIMHMETDLGGPIWFLRALLIMSCLFIVIEFATFKLIHDKRLRYIVLFIIVMAMYFVGKAKILPNVYNLRKIFVNTSFFFMGVIVREYKIDEFIDRYKVLTIVLGTGAILATTYFFKGGIGKYSGCMDLPGNLLGILGVFAISKIAIVEKSGILSFLGKASLDIMALHFIGFKSVEYFIIVFTGQSLERMQEGPVLRGTCLPVNLLYVVCSVCMCSLAYYLRININNLIKRKMKV
ncbi:MAG: acyltransferase family protein [Butyrivibrio sp.]|uniref:acyltransferase family protein n=1 Tax=Butyrivibrio sp. TaxID=28121 RepID=UPI0025C6F7FE|nr:acyltransferase family protein [Butyrivibrio sp.]MBQ6587588.1 acyltransferase family protein [Butyrivibrio sp.]